jgi:hypothetical protein
MCYWLVAPDALQVLERARVILNTCAATWQDHAGLLHYITVSTLLFNNPQGNLWLCALGLLPQGTAIIQAVMLPACTALLGLAEAVALQCLTTSLVCDCVPDAAAACALLVVLAHCEMRHDITRPMCETVLCKDFKRHTCVTLCKTSHIPHV